IVVMRKDEQKTFAATIGKQPKNRSYSYSFTPRALPRIPRAPRVQVFVNHGMLGMELSSLNEQLGKYFEAPDGKGVLVNEVEDGSKAEKAGFQAGDVITKVGKESVEEPRDVWDALEDFKEGEKAEFEIIRKGSKKTLTLEVPDIDRKHRFYFYNSRPSSQMFRDLDIDIDLDDLDCIEEDQGHLKHEMEKLRLELREMGREIREKALQLKKELKAKFSQVMS
ncbi:MAG: PDZ domain-containing protein, partial [Bacteroidota bacterium]